jgi:hypothetical protein
MPSIDGELLFEINKVLHLNHRELADFLGISRRTMQRVYSGGSVLGGGNLKQLAVAIHPTNPELAARVAQRASTTLQALGLVAASPPTMAAPGAVQPVKVATPHPRLADSVVYVAADILDLAPRAVRPAMLAAFRRAHELGLTVEMITAALEDAAPPKPING